MHGLKSAILAILPEIGWIGHALLVQPSISAHRKWPEMVVSASTNQVWTKITIRSYAWSFAIQIQIQAVCLSTFYRKKPVEHDVITFYYVFENAEKHPNVRHLRRYIW